MFCLASSAPVGPSRRARSRRARADRVDIVQDRLKRLQGLRVAIPASAILTVTMGLAMFGGSRFGEAVALATQTWGVVFGVGILVGTLCHERVARREVDQLRCELIELR